MSAGCLSNVCPSSSPNPYKMSIINDVASDPIQKQGFLSILNNNNTNPPNFSSIRRTFSSEMLVVDQPAMSMIKRAQSSHQLDFLGKDDDHDHDKEINGGGCEKKGAFEDIWSSIQKNGGSGSSGKSGSDLPPPYVHPQVKRSTSLLSQKSLEICTESLGSETGSETGLDVLSPYPASDPGPGDHKQGEELQMKLGINHDDDHVGATSKCTSSTTVLPSIRRTLSSPPAVVPTMSSFPPPLPSLSHRGGPTNLHMRSLRRDGRLVVEAVPVPSVNRLRAQRQDGRLLLILANEKSDGEDLEDGENGGEVEQIPDKINGRNVVDYDHDEDDQEEDDQEEEEEENDDHEMAIVMETKNGTFKTTSSSSLLMSKIMELTATKNRSAWPRNFNATIVKTVLDQDDAATLAKSQLPPRPVRLVSAAAGTDSTATVLNAYEYYWRRRGNSGGGTAVAVLKPLAGQKRNNTGSGTTTVATATVHVGPQVGKDAAHYQKNKLLLAHKEKFQGEGEEEGGDEGVELEKGGLIKAEENLVPWLRGCKEPTRGRSRSGRSSLLFWDSSEPAYCIATS